MITMLQSWPGSVDINGKHYDSVKDATRDFKGFSGIVNIKLYPKQVTTPKIENTENPEARKPDNREVKQSDQEFRITVKKYMTEKSVPGFDFMAKWNNDNPMPLRVMTGKVLQETKGMVKMELHGDIWAEKICTCMCCGRKLTNPVSQYFGIGPECGGHNYTHPFDTDEELREAVKEYRKQLLNTTWTGWIIRSAITNTEQAN